MTSIPAKDNVLVTITHDTLRRTVVFHKGGTCIGSQVVSLRLPPFPTNDDLFLHNSPMGIVRGVFVKCIASNDSWAIHNTGACWFFDLKDPKQKEWNTSLSMAYATHASSSAVVGDKVGKRSWSLGTVERNIGGYLALPIAHIATKGLIL